jgi:protein TonB
LRPLQPGAALDNRRLWLAIAISLAVHGVADDAAFQLSGCVQGHARKGAGHRPGQRASSAKKPTDAQALAQANLDGGGNTDENRRLKTPLPPTPQQTAGNEIERMQRRMRELDAAQQKMLSEAKAARAATRNAASRAAGALAHA